VTSSAKEVLDCYSATTHRALFCKVIDRACCIETFGHVPIDSSVCVAGHDLNRLLVERFFNCVAKNLVKDITYLLLLLLLFFTGCMYVRKKLYILQQKQTQRHRVISREKRKIAQLQSDASGQ